MQEAGAVYTEVSSVGHSFMCLARCLPPSWLPSVTLLAEVTHGHIQSLLALLYVILGMQWSRCASLGCGASSFMHVFSAIFLIMSPAASPHTVGCLAFWDSISASEPAATFTGQLLAGSHPWMPNPSRRGQSSTGENSWCSTWGMNSSGAHACSNWAFMRE